MKQEKNRHFQRRFLSQAAVFPALRHLSLQYTTLAQSRSHFLRQVNGLPQTGQTLDGRLWGLRNVSLGIC